MSHDLKSGCHSMNLIIHLHKKCNIVSLHGVTSDEQQMNDKQLLPEIQQQCL